MNRIVAAIGISALAACTTAYPGSPQACAGINDAHVEWNAQTGRVSADLCAGKENDRVRLSGKTPGGLEFSYEAEGAKAFGGQMTAAEMNRELGALRADIVREMAAAIRDAVNPAQSLVP